MSPVRSTDDKQNVAAAVTLNTGTKYFLLRINTHSWTLYNGCIGISCCQVIIPHLTVVYFDF